MPETTPSAVGGQLWLPTTAKELQRLGWEQCDVILFSGDAYVDHPAFGAAVIGRVLQSHGYKVAIVPQPTGRTTCATSRSSAAHGCFRGIARRDGLDGQPLHSRPPSASRRCYTPGGRHGARPDYPSIVYTKILKELYPDIPVVLGGIEPSLRRLSHYDYWQDRLRPSILMDSPADMLVYGMGEKTTCAIAAHLDSGLPLSELTDLEQTVILLPKEMTPQPDDSNIVLHSMEECLASKRCQAENFKHIEQQSNRYHGATLWQVHGDKVVKVNPMYPP